MAILIECVLGDGLSRGHTSGTYGRELVKILVGINLENISRWFIGNSFCCGSSVIIY